MTEFHELLHTDNPPESAEVFREFSDEQLAYYLAEDAGDRGQAGGEHNHFAATREAARRLHERFTGREREWIEFGKKMYAEGHAINEALTKILYKKDTK